MLTINRNSSPLWTYNIRNNRHVYPVLKDLGRQYTPYYHFYQIAFKGLTYDRYAFNSASAEDRRVLRSEDRQDIVRRARFKITEKGRNFFVIRDTTEDPSVSLFKVLYSSGKSLKTKRIPDERLPNVVFIDSKDVSYGNGIDFLFSEPEKVSHAELVEAFAKKHNPFANYHIEELPGDFNAKELYNAVKEVESNKVNCLSLSIGIRLPVKTLGKILDLELSSQDIRENKDLIRERMQTVSNKSIEELLSKLKDDEYFNEKSRQITTMSSRILHTEPDSDEEIETNLVKKIQEEIHYINEILNIIDKLTSKGIKVFISAGNGDKDSINLLLLANDVNVIGSFNRKKEISRFSSSRNLSTDYEQGEFKVVFTEHGINFTDVPGVDVTYDKFGPEGFYEKYAGKPISDFELTQAELESVWEEKEPLKTLKRSYADKLIKANDFEELEAYVTGRSNRESKDNVYYQVHPNIMFEVNSRGNIIPYKNRKFDEIAGTSFSQPIAMAKTCLRDFLTRENLI